MPVSPVEEAQLPKVIKKNDGTQLYATLPLVFLSCRDVREFSYRTSFKPTDFALFTHEHNRFGFRLQYAVKSFL